ncbi:MAG: zinc ribbon domain-containing protein [Candidatus Bathyarchaeia archaeon]
MAKKGIAVWIFSSLTFMSLLHLVEAVSVLFFDGEIRLLQLYPFLGEKLKAIAPMMYFWVSAALTFTLWGITCAVAFESPVEAFLNKILSEAGKQSVVEAQFVEEKSEILDAMNETIEANGEKLAHVRDIVYSLRSEVKKIETLTEIVEEMKTELNGLRKDFRSLEEKVHLQRVCLSCGKPLLPEFKVCPYCGENVKIPQEIIIPSSYK